MKNSKPEKHYWADEFIPYKEGFLNKEWKLATGYQKYSYHWYLSLNFRIINNLGAGWAMAFSDIMTI